LAPVRKIAATPTRNREFIGEMREERKRGKTGGGMNLRFTGGHESDSFWECCRPPTSMAYRMPI
jgi:hypothetical protein